MLAIPSWVGAMSASQRAVTRCGWGVKASMVLAWVAGKTVYLSALGHYKFTFYFSLANTQLSESGQQQAMNHVAWSSCVH